MSDHGLFILEEATALAVPRTSGASVQVVIGTAPVNLVDDPSAVVNTPIMANSATEAMGLLGFSDSFQEFTLCQSMYLTGNLFPVAPVVYINVLDPAKHKKPLAEGTYQINSKQAIVDKTGILRDSAAVKTTGLIDVYTRVAPETGDNPSAEGWYVVSGGSYSETTDTSVASGTTYYRRVFVDEIDAEGDPSEQGYYEEAGDGYVLTTDTEVEDGKSYYSLDYSAVTATPASNPAAEGWYELVGGEYVESTDTAAKSSDVYYEKTQEEGEIDLVEGVDYSTEFDDDGYLVITVLAGGNAENATSVKVSGEQIDPSAVTVSDIVGSYNASTGVEKGLEVIRQVYPKLGVVPGLLLAPGWSQEPTVGIALAAKAAQINGCFKAVALVDIDTAQARVYTDCKKVKEDSGFTSTFAAAYWPCDRIGDYIFAKSAVVGALTAYYDSVNDDVPSRSPSNEMLGVTGQCLADGTEVNLDQNQANTVNSYGVTTAINLNGWRLWGNYTTAYPASGDAKDIWFPVRRMFNWQGNNFLLTYFDKVDDPMNRVLIESVVDSENIRCAAYAPEKWAGASIEYRSDDNPITDILAGKITFRQKIAPYTPAQEIVNIISYDTDLLARVLGGE